MVLVDIEMPTSCGECEASGTSVCKKWATNPDLKVVSPECPIKTEITDKEYRTLLAQRKVNELFEARKKWRKEHGLPETPKPTYNDDFGTPACTEDGEYLVGGEPDDYYDRRD